MIPFINRFHGHNSLSYVYKNGRAIHAHWFIIKTTLNPHRKNSRFAVVISKKVLKSAVKRNRVRRQVYEYINTKLMPKLNDTYDIAIIATSGELFTASQADIFNQLDQIFGQINIQKTSKKV